MGASGWHYFVPYDTDVSRALAKLREDVFKRGDYYCPSKKKPKSIEELIELCEESGTHSILDVTRVVDTSSPPSMNTWFQSLGGRAPTQDEMRAFTQSQMKAFGTVAPAPAAAISAACKTDKPDHAALEKALFGFHGLSARGTGLWTAV